MIGLSLNIKNNIIKKFKIYNNDKSIHFTLKDYKVWIIGNILDENYKIKNKILNSIKINQYKDVLKFNGEYLIVIYSRKKNFFLVGNSINSYIPIFYAIEKKEIFFESLIFNLDKRFFSELDTNRIYEYLAFSGRSFDSKTFLKRVKSLEVGSYIILKNSKYQFFNSKCFSYNNNKKINNYNIDKVYNDLNNAINDRILKANKNISFGLSGGLDSRILLSLITQQNLKKIKCHTLGNKKNYETEIAMKVSKILKIKNRLVNVPLNYYFDYAEEGIKKSGFDTVFKQGSDLKTYKFLKRKDKSTFIMIANALDVLIASSFSDTRLKKIKNKEKYLQWFVKKYQLFNVYEINKFFNLNQFPKNDIIYKPIKRLINRIEYNKDFVNLNDALTFESRIKRWHNSTIRGISNSLNFLIPTYDIKFLKSCSNIPSRIRLSGRFRRLLMKKSNLKLSKLITANQLINKYKKNSAKKYQNKLYEVNLGYEMKKGKKFLNFFNKIKKDFLKHSKKNIINLDYVDQLIEEHRISKRNNTRKIFMMVTLIISLTLIFKKNNYCRL